MKGSNVPNTTETMSESELLARSLFVPYKPIVKEFNVDEDEDDDMFTSYAELYDDVMIYVNIENGNLILIIEEYDYTLRGRNRVPREIELIDKSWVLSDPNAIDNFHKEMRKFIKEHYLAIMTKLKNDLTERESIMEEIFDGN